MKIENMLQSFSCISFLFKPPYLDKENYRLLSVLFNVSKVSERVI